MPTGNSSFLGQAPITTWFSKKSSTAHIPVKRKQPTPDSSQSTPSGTVKKSRTSGSNAPKAADQQTQSSFKPLNYLQPNSGHAYSPHTPQYKSSSRNNTSLPTPPESTRPTTKPWKTGPDLHTPSDADTEKDNIFGDVVSAPTRALSAGFSSCTVIDLSDDEAMFADQEIPSSQTQELDITSFSSTNDFVASSQSQLLDIWENPSPRKNKRLKNAVAPEPTLEMIPSSQTQEWDLEIPLINTQTRSVDNLFSVSALSYIPFRFQSTKPNARPLNKDLFGSFSDHATDDSPLDDICAELDVIASSSAARTNRRTLSDPQCLEVDQTSAAPLAEKGVDADRNNSHSAPDLPELDVSDLNHDNTPTKPTPSPEPEQNYQESQQDESMPEVVKDFLDMFGSMEGSYPPDFPESLKD
ncbi:hypothetical protein CVT24_002045 [Panaeolus cyanescens]|uniref:Uncharacterized protein n=1 Tax=Panaeolus cyanescens TaxID=181874 RepID=A0A409YHQ4_9AGAR|nr:hypothetical protein CVT24_002045 [Panaeolus cyanescens]